MRQRRYIAKRRPRRTIRWASAAGGSLLRRLPAATGEPDYVLTVAIGLLLLFGLIMLSSASSVLSFQRHGWPYYFFSHQVALGVIPGLAVGFIASRLDYRRWARWTLWLLPVTLGLLLVVFIPGLAASFGSAHSWIEIAGLSFQPSEIAKLTLILFWAGWFSQRGPDMAADFRNGLVPFVAIMGLIAALLLLQPDLGTLVILSVISLCMYLAAGGRWRHIIGLLVAGIGGAALMISQRAYLANRLLAFLRPEEDPLGVAYHINQAFLAVGSGGWLGLGYGQSRQKFSYLPEVIGDSIFAVIAEEMGFLVAAGVVVLFIVLLVRGIRAGRLAPDFYGQLVAVGITCWFVTQAFANIAAMIGLMPLTGITLPFISYGGSAMLSSLTAIGLLISISRHGRHSSR